VTQIRRYFGIVFALVVVAAAVPLLAACGGGGDDGGSGGNSTVDLGGAVALKTDIPKDLPDQIIEVKDNSFTPDSVTIKAGTKVIWKWVDTQNKHSVQMLGSTSPEQSSGTFEAKFDQSGSTISYQCGVHKEAMTGKIIVE